MSQALLSRRQVIAATTMSGPTLWRRCKDGTFPPPLKIGPNRVAWARSDVDHWISKLRRTDGELAFTGEDQERTQTPDLQLLPDPSRPRRGRRRKTMASPSAAATLGEEGQS
jgi:prophage regulatory protein